MLDFNHPNNNINKLTMQSVERTQGGLQLPTAAQCLSRIDSNSIFSDSNDMSMQDEKEDEEERSKPQFNIHLTKEPEKKIH
jgi:hypothetical protein